MSRQWAQKKSGSNSSMPVQKSSSWQRPFSDPIYDAPAPKQTPSVQAKRRNVDWSRVTVEAPSQAGVQAKLTVGTPGDKYEQEADAMANKVMTMPAPGSSQPIQREMAPEEKQEEVQTKPLAAAITPLVQRETAPEENKEEEVQAKPHSGSIQRETAPEENKEEEVQTKPQSGSIQRETAPEENKEEEVQTKPHSGSIQRETAPEENKEEEVQTKPAPEGKSQNSGNLESQLSGSKGGGSPLSDEVRAFMEPRFGADFSGVRVHTDGAAVQMNQELGAQAFAHGSDIYYGAGKSPGKDELTAHELTHVVQQTGGVQNQLQATNISSARQPQISRLSTPSIQASFISFVVKMGAKKASLAILKKFIKEQIKDKIQKIAIKKFAKQFAKEADDLIGVLEDPWWVTAIGFIPIVGDAFDLARVPKQIATAMKKADALEEKVKKVLRIQGKKAGDLIPSTLKKSESYASELENHTYAQIVEMAEGGSAAAKKMKKLIEQTERLMEKL
ncbi:DUF4157 domain-containing protein [Microseira sp. BLCC-F43]|uniref:eCIS core domain-containing protein n=1 Tax=Microseira sp. BLCC-F43 TaxID=3153602 RepID=UPI0035BA8806